MTSITSFTLSFLRTSYMRSAEARVLSLAAQFILIYIASRVVEPSTFGEFTTLLSAALFVGVYFSMGQVGAAYKSLPKLVKENSTLELSNELSNITTLFVYFIPFLSLPFLLCLMVLPNVKGLIFYVLGTGIMIALLETLSVVLRAYNRIFMSDFCKNSIWRISFIILTLSFLGSQVRPLSISLKDIFVISLSIAVVMGVVITSVISKPLIRIKPFQESFGKLKSDASRWLISVSNIIFSSLDVVAVGVLVGLTEAGIYFILVRMASIPGLILSITNPVIVPIISRISKGDFSSELRRLVKRNTLVNVSITLFLCLLIYFSRDIIFPLLSGYEKNVGNVLLLLVLGQFVNAAAGPTVLTSQIFDIQKETILLIILSFIVFVIGIYGFVPQFGIIAMAFTVLCIRIIQNIGIVILLRFKSGFSIFTGSLNLERGQLP